MPIPSLRVIADSTLIAAALSVTLVAGRLYFESDGRRPIEPRVVAPTERLSLPGIDFNKGQRTLLLVLRSNCPYCEKSMPFYSRMVASKSEQSRVVVVGGEDKKVLNNYLKIHDVAVDGVAIMTRDETPSEVTPTLILVGSDGIVSKVWRGQLSPAAENEVIQLMSQ